MDSIKNEIIRKTILIEKKNVRRKEKKIGRGRK